MIFLWLKRFVLTSHHIFKFETWVSLMSLVLGVACLVVTMTVMSSYETTLKGTLIDHTGHLIVMNKKKAYPADELKKKIKPLLSEPYQSTPFVSLEALALHQGVLRGIVLEGIDLKSVKQVLNLNRQLVQGHFIEKPNEILIGKELAHQLGLKTGSSFFISYTQILNKEEWRPQLKSFFVKGVLDLGRYDFNSRYVMGALPAVQQLKKWKNKVTGLRLRFSSPEIMLQEKRTHLKKKLGPKFWVQDWKGIHQNLFKAIQMEKTLIFFVLLVLILSAGFNVSNQMFLDVLKRFRDIGILKTMGAGPFLIAKLFLVQGCIVGLIGISIGFLLGGAICWILFGFYGIWGRIIPSEIYKLNQIVLDFRWGDFLSIFVFSFLVCLLSTWIPIRKALRLTPKEGLIVE